ncbi:MspA family porin [Nocardia vaccinii]|uniref:MspA family porin n=1 Tax=Nocardia vaccinii TaxID=1822 RepID=UPI000B25C303|nr:MspA family porin [Nocardia vaccinii]
MRCPLTVAAATTVAACMAVLGLWGGGVGRAQSPGANIAGAGVHLTASVDKIGVNPPGDRTPNVLMTFSHAVQVSGDYSVDVGGDPIRSGQAVAGFLLGCGISTAGVKVGIGTGQILATGNSSALAPPNVAISAPARGSLGPRVRGLLGLGEFLGVSLEPGQVTTATTATIKLDGRTAFPFRIRFDNAALNVSQCTSPVAAVPFITTTVSTAQAMTQTTSYGNQFTF